MSPTSPHRLSIYDDSEPLLQSSLLELIKLIKDDKDQALADRNLDEKFLTKFVRAAKFDSKHALYRIKCYFELRRAHPEVFKLPSQVQDLFDLRIVEVLKERGPDGELIVIFRPGNWDPSTMDITHLMSMLVAHFEIMLDEDEEFQKKGIIDVMDCRGVGMRHLWVMTPSLQALMTEMNERGVPFKFKRVNHVYASRIIEVFWNMFKWLMGADLRERIIFHGSLESLHKEVPPHLLPEEFGGTATGDLGIKWSESDLKELDAKVTAYWNKYPVEAPPKS